MRVTRRSFLAQLTAGGAAIVLAACGGSAAVSTSSAPASSSAAAPASSAAAPSASRSSAAASPSPSAASPAASASASAKPAASAAAGNRPALAVRSGGDGSTLDPAFFSLIFDYQVINNVYSALLRYKHGTNELIPDLATKWDTSSDGKTYTFTLRQGVKWHKNFGNFTSADVKYSYERIMDPATKSPWASQFKGIDSITTPDDNTVKIALKQPDAFFLYKVSSYRQGFVVNQKAVQQYGQDYGRNPVGTGPFVFNHWTPKTEVVLDPNDAYFDGPPKVGQVTFKVQSEAATAQASFEKGETDIYTYLFEPDAYKRYKSDPSKYNLETSGAASIFLLGWNAKHPPLDKPQVRQALAYAIDRKQVIDSVLGGIGTVGDKGPIPPPIAPAPPSGLPDYGYDVNKAKQMLQAAGVNNLELTAQIPTQFPFPDWFTAIQAFWQQIGVKLNIQTMDAAAWFGAVGKGNVEVSAQPITARPDPDTLVTSFYTSGGFPPGLNFMYYSGVDSLADQARVELDKSKRDQIYQQAETKFMTDLPALPLWYYGFTDVTHKNISNYAPGLFFDVWLYPVVKS